MKILLVYFLFSSCLATAQPLNIMDFEEEGITIKYLMSAFQKNKPEMLRDISSKDFIKSKEFQVLSDYITSYEIDFFYAKESCRIYLKIDQSADDLVLEFQRSKNKDTWLPLEAMMMHNGELVSLPHIGYSGLAHTDNFIDFISAVEQLDAEYISFFPNGKINLKFAKSKKLIPSSKKEYIFQDVIVHNKGSIVDIFTLKLRFLPVSYKVNNLYRSGWLIDKVISAKDYYKTGENAFVDIFFQRLMLSEKNDLDFFHANLRDGMPTSVPNAGSGEIKFTKTYSRPEVSNIRCHYHSKENKFRFVFDIFPCSQGVEMSIEHQGAEKVVITSKYPLRESSSIYTDKCLSLDYNDNRFTIKSEANVIRDVKSGYTDTAFYVDIFY